MSQFGQPRSLIGPMLLLFLSCWGCSRPASGVASEESTQGSDTPFQQQATDSPTASPSTALLARNAPDSNLPFQSFRVLPAGSLLTIRLNSPIIAEKESSNDLFEAIVDEPVVVEGMTLIPRGTAVSGRIGSVRTSNVQPNRGYVRLSLRSLNLDGLDLPVQTAVLFARQVSGHITSGRIHLDKGRRLTFRLTEPFYPGAQRPAAGQ